MPNPRLLLGVNIDHVATLRQVRYRGAARTHGGFVEPDPAVHARLAERAGADGITIHLREDRRHIQEEDVWRVREAVRVPLNLEMACTPAMLEFALKLAPANACLVPENRTEVTTEGGLDVAGQEKRVGGIVRALLAAGIRPSMFIDPDDAQIDASARIGAPVVELHTGAYANACDGGDRAGELERLRRGAERAHAAGLTVNAGHGINYENIAEIRTLPHLHELNIGHSIVCRALTTGMERAVRDMLAAMNPA